MFLLTKTRQKYITYRRFQYFHPNVHLLQRGPCKTIRMDSLKIGLINTRGWLLLVTIDFNDRESRDHRKNI